MTAPAPAVAYVPVERLQFHPRNVRRELGDLRELSASIAQHGVLQPLVVERRPGAELLRVLAGHRRLQAARIAGLPKVPCVLIAPHADGDAITLMLTENLMRSGLTHAERRDAVRELITKHGHTPTTAAQRLGVSVSTIYSWLRVSEHDPLPASLSGTSPRPPRASPAPSSRGAAPRIAPRAVAELVDRWRPRAGSGLTGDEAALLLNELAAMLGGWRPPEPR